MKEILVHLKPNNFPRYIDQLSDLEGKINAIDATKFNHNVTTTRSEDVVSEAPPDASAIPASVDSKEKDAKESEENSVEDKPSAVTSKEELRDVSSNEQSNEVTANEEPKEISKEEVQDISPEHVS